MDCRHPTSHRLKSRSDFRVLLKTPKRFRLYCAGFELLLRPHEQPDSPCRLGVRISKKHVRRAVQRNTIRRQMRELFRNRDRSAAHYDLLLHSRKGLAEQLRPDFRAAAAEALNQLEHRLLQQ